MTIAGKSFTVNQATGTCSFTVSPSFITQTAAGGTGTITVTTQSGCAWTTSSNAAWVTITGSGTGSGTASYTVQPNTGFGRSALLNIGGVMVGVSQAAGTDTAPSGLRVIIK
jgi:hypothetical protein